MSHEQIARELVGVEAVPENLGIDESRAEFINDHIGIPRHVEPLKLHERMRRAEHRGVRLFIGRPKLAVVQKKLLIKCLGFGL